MGGMLVPSLRKSFHLQQYIDQLNIMIYVTNSKEDAFHSDVLCIESEL